MRTSPRPWLVVVLFVLSAGSLRAAPPNILFITIDNVGYGDLPTYNAKSAIRTPRLDQLAAEGARLTNFYTASPTCTVSRACLLTGRIAQRHGLLNQLPGVAGNYGVGLDQRERLIPQYLRDSPTPYATGCFGKWNIGFAPGSRPTERGFDEFIGHASGNMDYYRHNYRETHDLFVGTVELHKEGTYATDLFADAAIDFIRRKSQASAPWFCYLPFNAPHFPTAGNRRNGEANEWQAPDWALAEYGLSPDETDPTKRFYANMTALDRAIGRVLDALDDVGAAADTFVICLSDNGAFTQLGRKGIDVGSNAPLHDGGITCWEGGIRVPAFARWPGRIAPGSVISEACWSPDLLVTAAYLADAPLADDIILDGKDLLPLLTNGESSPHRSLFFQFRNHAALRMGDWKIVREKPDANWTLFNLADDISEQHDLATQYPQRLAQLTAEFDRWERDAAASRQPPTFLEFIRRQAAGLRAGDAPPTSLDDWQQRGNRLREKLQQSWGTFPQQTVDLEPRILGTLDREGYRVEKLLFQTMPGVWMTANAYVPDGDGKRPAVLCVHGHWKGAKQDPHVQARCIGLTKLGFFVLAVDAFGAGERAIGKSLGEYHGEMTAATLLPVGRPLSGVQVYENQRAVDYLQTRPEVDSERIGITGASGGGNQSMYAGAWDERFDAVVPVCSVGNYQAYLGAACCLCEVVPGALQFTEEWGILGLTAPRALMVINATRDAHQFSVSEANTSLAAASDVFQLSSSGDKLRHTTFESQHAYNQPMREAMYGWMTLHLKSVGDGSPIAEPEMILAEPESLRCYPGASRPDDWLTIPQFAAREAQQLVDRVRLPESVPQMKELSSKLSTRLDHDVLGGTTPHTKIVSAGLSSPRDVVLTPEQKILLRAQVVDGVAASAMHRLFILTCDGTDTQAVRDYEQVAQEAGYTVVTLGLRATGDQAYERDRIGRAPDHNTAEWSLWIGRPLLGQWVQDVRAAIEATSSAATESGEITLVGIGPAGTAAICAAVVDEQINYVIAVDSLTSYVSAVPYENQRLGLMAPGILRKVGDIPYIAALLAPRGQRLMIAGGVAGSGQTLNDDDLAANYRVTQQAFDLCNASEQLQVLTHTSASDVLKSLGNASKQ